MAKPNLKLKCPSCGEVSCFVATQNQLQHYSAETLGNSGKVIPNPLIKLGTAFEDWVIGDQDKYSCCEKCGYYEKLE